MQLNIDNHKAVTKIHNVTRFILNRGHVESKSNTAAEQRGVLNVLPPETQN